MFPADYEIHFYSTIVDTGSLNGILANFKIFEVTNGMEPQKQRFAIFDSDQGEGTWNIGERVVLLIGEEGLNPSWEFTLYPPQQESSIEPGNNDILKISTT